MKTFKAFILAAGFGERLRPLTDYLPKPLLPILGKSVIETVLDRINRLSPAEVGINGHYKWQMIRDWLKTLPCSGKPSFFREDEVLGTGGGLYNARAFLKDSFFLVHNADILSDLAIEDLIGAHFRSGNVVTLAVRDDQRFNNVWIDRKGELYDVTRNSPGTDPGLCAVAFTGIAAYSPEFIDFLPPGRSSVVDAWLNARHAGKKVGTIDFSGCRWTDIGTPEAYSAAVFETLHQWGEILHVDPSVECSGLVPSANTVIEKGCIIEGKASLRDCIVLPGAKIPDGATMANAILGPGYIVPINTARASASLLSSSFVTEILCDFSRDSGRAPDVVRIGIGGSDRNYYRVSAEKKSAVLMECPSEDIDFRRHILYTAFFSKNGIPVPALISKEPGRDSRREASRKPVYALFEDLGDISLYSWLKCGRSRESIEALYRSVLDILANLHTSVTERVSDCPLLAARVFDYEHLRWETDYFYERFVKGILDISFAGKEELDREFERLASRVDAFEKTIVHRDFQSQNIMVTEDDIPRIIDYQGARLGPPAYDLASILWDPYVRLDDGMRRRLVDHYVSVRKQISRKGFDETRFTQTIIPCRLQRHMQALGAYGFLSKTKGKAYFLKHVPEALRHLKGEAEAVREEYPVLYALMREVDEKTGN